ncbi:hypothetical protein EJB05_45187 [Eragrostis curvula]|uniref:Uncharacterized protein n=1 Tax=Eragrostis curvula TaxID=38414 RepID=A0A5J9TJK2_9POAL|nr:hypothetical protein EJB05_45187 [Eragrostis curvula]
MSAHVDNNSFTPRLITPKEKKGREDKAMADDRVQQGDGMDEPVVVQENYPMMLFCDINLDLITSKINFSAKVYFKAHVRAHKDGNYIRLILVDEEGTRMEALAFGRTCLDLARTIVEGESYDFIDVIVGYSYDLNFHNYMALNSLQALPLKAGFLTLEDHVIGVVVYISNVHDTKRTWRRPSRHVAIMNTMQIFVIHVRSPHILRHAGEWRPAAQYFNTIAALHVQMNTRRGVLVTTRYSKIIFEPDRPEAEAMRAIYSNIDFKGV